MSYFKAVCHRKVLSSTYHVQNLKIVRRYKLHSQVFLGLVRVFYLCCFFFPLTLFSDSLKSALSASLNSSISTFTFCLRCASLCCAFGLTVFLLELLKQLFFVQQIFLFSYFGLFLFHAYQVAQIFSLAKPCMLATGAYCRFT